MQSPGHTTYFVNPTTGNDTHPGTTADQPWRTLAPVQACRFATGDRIEIQPGAYQETLLLTGAGTAQQPIEIRLFPGEYDFYPDKAEKRILHISNTNDDPYTPKPVAWLFQNIRHLVVTGNESHVYVHGKMIELMYEHAENVTLNGITFDYRRPLVSEFTILNVAEHSADVEIQKDCTYAIENGRLIWIGEGWRSFGLDLNQECDPDDDGRTWRRHGPLTETTRAEELAPFRVRFFFDANPGFTKGRILQFRETFRDMAAGFILQSKNLSFQNGAFHALGGMGIVHQFSENITYTNMKIAPRPGSGRTTCAWADMLHFSGCRGHILVDTVTFSGSHDDPINVHGTHLRIVEQPTANQIIVRFLHPQTYGFPAFFAGDEIEFVHAGTLRAYSTCHITAATMKGEKEMILTLSQSAPAWQENDVIENVTWTPSVTIRNCRVSVDSCRGFLLTTRRPILVEGNAFVKTTMSAINISDDASSWFESGPVRDVTIRGNQFLQCGEPVIRIIPENHTANPEEPVHQNIRILDNRFALVKKGAIKARSVQGLTIAGNRFSTEILPVETEACTDVRVDNNQMKDDGR